MTNFMCVSKNKIINSIKLKNKNYDRNKTTP